MRKFMYFAAALLVLVGCNKKDNALNNAPEGTPFEKGQQVTLTVGTGAQQGPNKVAGVDNTAENRIDFTWVEGDKILVKVGDKTAEFTLTTGAGSADGEFTGTMPAAGSSFDIQYPIVDSYLNEQNYTTENPIAGYKMLFKATGCTLGEPATLTAQYAMVQLNLYGTDKTIGKIVLTNTTADPVESYTLTCTDGKTIGATSAEATPFYMVVPTGTYQFEAEIWDNATTPAMICSFATSEAKTFAAGECLNMPAKEVKDPYNGHAYVDLGLPSGLKWATCNLGATTPEGYGDYFAWGETAPYYNTPITDPITWKEDKTSGYAWQSYCGKSTFNEWNPAPYDATTNNLKPEYDAAHVNWGGNWRMPTKAEQEELINNCTRTWTENYNSTGVNGYLVTSKINSKFIFLPASGYYKNSSLTNVGSIGYCLSSSLYVDIQSAAWCLSFNSDGESWSGLNRNYGRPVRPVCQ